MKTIKQIFLFFLPAMLFACQTDYRFIETGTSNGKHDTSMWDYFRTDAYNWDSTIVLIERAGMIDIFKGNNAQYKEITFFGPTNHSIRRYLYQNKLNRVTDLTVDECRDIVLSSLVKGRIMRDDIPRGKRSAEGIVGTGGKTVTTANGKKLWLYTFREAYEEVPDTGPVFIYLAAPATSKQTRVASSNIETNNGVVHSLIYDFTIKDF